MLPGWIRTILTDDVALLSEQERADKIPAFAGMTSVLGETAS